MKQSSYMDSVHKCGVIWNLSMMVILLLFILKIFNIL